MKTDILVEPEVKGSEQLYKEIYIVIHTAYIVWVIPYQVTQGLPVQIIDFDEILLI